MKILDYYYYFMVGCDSMGCGYKLEGQFSTREAAESFIEDSK